MLANLGVKSSPTYGASREVRKFNFFFFLLLNPETLKLQNSAYFSNCHQFIFVEFYKWQRIIQILQEQIKETSLIALMRWRQYEFSHVIKMDFPLLLLNSVSKTCYY